MLLFLISCLWLIVFARAIAFRATLANTTFAVFALLGAVIGPPLATLVFKTIDPYGWTIDSTTPGYFFMQLLGALVIQAILLLPVWYLYVRRRASLALSVCDAFLLAFAIGFGADVVGMLIAAAHGTALAGILAFLPPWQVVTPVGTIAGYAYWLGIVALTWAAASRFIGERRTANIVAIAVFVWFAIEHAVVATLTNAGNGGPSDDGTFSRLTLLWHGQFTAWIAIVAVVALAFYERRWVIAAGAAASNEKDAPTFQAALAAFVGGRMAEAQWLSEQVRARLQLGIVRAELAAAPNDERLQRIAGDLQERIRVPTPADPGTLNTDRAAAWVARNQFAAGAWALFVVVALLLPRVAGLDAALWTFPPLLTLAAILVFFLGYLGTAVDPSRPLDVDGFLRANGARLLRVGALSLAMILVFASSIFGAQAAPIASSYIALPALDPAHWAVYLLLLALAAVTSTSRPLTGLTKAVSGPERIAFAVNLTTALALYLVFWVDLWLFNSLRAWFHQVAVNDQTYYIFKFNLQNFGDVLTATLVLVFSYVLYRLLRSPIAWAQNVIAPRAAGG